MEILLPTTYLSRLVNGRSQQGYYASHATNSTFSSLRLHLSFSSLALSIELQGGCTNSYYSGYPLLNSFYVYTTTTPSSGISGSRSRPLASQEFEKRRQSYIRRLPIPLQLFFACVLMGISVMFSGHGKLRVLGHLFGVCIASRRYYSEEIRIRSQYMKTLSLDTYFYCLQGSSGDECTFHWTCFH